MTRYYAGACLFCMLGMVVAIAFDRPLSALLFSLGASCFVLRAWWAMRQPEPIEGWFVEHLNIAGGEVKIDSFTLNGGPGFERDGLVILPPGATLEGAQRSYPQWRKREAFRRYREHWAGVGQ